MPKRFELWRRETASSSSSKKPKNQKIEVRTLRRAAAYFGADWSLHRISVCQPKACSSARNIFSGIA
jgi:hypothetical protein